MERILGVLNSYRKKHLALEEEHEALVNVIDTLCSLLLVQELAELFRKLQGLELVQSLARSQPHLRRHVIKLLDYSLAQNQLNLVKNCKHFV
jgi:hypothetical protein